MSYTVKQKYIKQGEEAELTCGHKHKYFSQAEHCRKRMQKLINGCRATENKPPITEYALIDYAHIIEC